ncbi:molybdopterin-dependent oxidoreductase [Bradyrhizobium sp. I71]|uniref:molybdopterin-containing oxidoreductase family protein n=1 Tax=Bradyrhizobium sp. I71 TaxID=2590772 RepID=UPI001EF8FA65|nr:molybdopterin-dependent oxidoreductase [Bradyrhizobium sp. I71]ULK98517.1 molybdopterin-dependent oxidoreductase [Bradyrhizobium sp. I71]
METKKVVCRACDMFCNVLTDVEDNRLIKVHRDPNHPITPHSLCNKGAAFADTVYHKDRLLYPMKSVGKRGEGKWERVSWEEALDGIAERLKKIVKDYGPEAVVHTSGETVPLELARRFSNLLGSPNWIQAGYLCLGNTADVAKVTAGLMPFPDFWHTKCIVLWGHDPQPNKWTAEYLWVRDAVKRGAKLIVIDPRNCFSAKRADMHLRIRPGTDSALALAWLNVIINEELYDKEFVAKWTHGFKELKERVQEYTPERVSEITWAPVDQIRDSARMYATMGPSIMPWSSSTDQTANSTHSLRCFMILRAICGYIDVEGGELMMGYHPTIVTEDEIAMTSALSSAQMAKQVGVDFAKVHSYELWDKLNDSSEKVFGRRWTSQIHAGAMSRPAEIWTAMAEGIPYPIKSLITVGSDPLTGYTDPKHAFEGLMNLDLIVAMDIFMCPTAQLADYVLPAANWAEKLGIHNHWDWHPIVIGGEKALEPPGECRDEFHFWRELAVRMGQGNHWPWETQREYFDWRLEKTGMNFDEFMAAGGVNAPETEYKKYENTGFATPTGKFELYSTIMEEFGYDPLPRWVEQNSTYVSNPELAKEYPLTYFVGKKDDPFFQSQGRQIASLRRLMPEPAVELHPDAGYDLGLSDGDYVAVETPHGKITGVVRFSDDAHPKVARVPYRWWFPEQAPYAPNFSGAFQSQDGLLASDSKEFADPEQGMPAIRGLMCKVYKIDRPEYTSALEELSENWGGFSDAWGGQVRRDKRLENATS